MFEALIPAIWRKRIYKAMQYVSGASAAVAGLVLLVQQNVDALGLELNGTALAVVTLTSAITAAVSKLAASNVLPDLIGDEPVA